MDSRPYQPAVPLTGVPLKPHRATAVLVLGICGICVVFVCGIIAWVMGRADLAEMRAGTMDRSGESTTRAGMICGIIGTAIGIALIVMMIVLFSAASAAMSSYSPPR